MLLALLALNVIQTVLLQLKMIPCDSALKTVSYVLKGPLSKFQPGAPHNLNPPLAVTSVLIILV